MARVLAPGAVCARLDPEFAAIRSTGAYARAYIGNRFPQRLQFISS